MEFLLTILAILLSIFISSFMGSLRKCRRDQRPSGPRPLPLIGSLHLLGDKPHESLTNLAMKHGPLMFIRLGFINAFVVSSSAIAKEVLLKNSTCCTTRAIPNATQACDYYKYSVVWLPTGSRWRGLRKLLHSGIFSSSRLDKNVNLRVKKVEEMITYCQKSYEEGIAVDIGRAAFRTSLNILSNTLFSVDLTDPFVDSGEEFKDLVWNIFKLIGKPNLVDFFPFLQIVDPQGIRRRLSKHFKKVHDIFHDLIDERLKHQNNENDTNDFIDMLLSINNEGDEEELDITHSKHVFLDLFAGGTHTTSSAIEWAMTEALRNPEVMKKAKKELDQVIGKGKILHEKDIDRLPYLRCIVKETLRIHPLGAFTRRKVDFDVEISGYAIPENSHVLINMWAIGRDPEVWTNPLEFKPERFINSTDIHNYNEFDMIPFGVGRRICPGLALATRTVPLILGSLLNCFEWKLEGGVDPNELDMEESFGLAIQKAQPLRAIPIPV